MSVVDSKIFSGYRALGLISNHVPCVIRYVKTRNETLVYTAIGKSFHTYGCTKLGLLSISDSLTEDIQCLAVDPRLIYTASGKNVYAWKGSGQLKHTFADHSSDVQFILPFGDHLVVADSDSRVKIWEINNQELYSELSFDNDVFRVSVALHPATYINKILFGSDQGKLQLWNVRTSTLVFTFDGWGSSVAVLEQAPAVDVVGIGLLDGQIILHNLKFDESLMKFYQNWGPVTAISFRTDNVPMMISGSAVGHIALWDLEKKQLHSQLRHAHKSAVAALHCFSNEPILVSNSGDNSVKMWIFDMPDGSGRLLRLREGHSSPPTVVRFHDQTGENILSSGQDSNLRAFSLANDALNRTLGQASFNRKAAKRMKVSKDPNKMPPIVAFTSEPTRDRDWDSIVACHRGLSTVTTWSFERNCMGEHKLLHDRFKNEADSRGAAALCVDITSCGNFVVIGYATGHVDKFNIQSGLFRGSYGDPTAHNGAVRGVCVDLLNQMVFSGGQDGALRVWRFKSPMEHLADIAFTSGIKKLRLQRSCSLLAVVLDDFVVHLVDIDTKLVVRKFDYHTNAITDLCFSSDSRWLLTSAMDCTICTWDIPSGHMVDCFALDSACTSLCISPTSDLLVTSHVDDLGLYLWSNKTLYSPVTLKPLPVSYQPIRITMPSSKEQADGGATVDEILAEDEDYKTNADMTEDLVQLALLPQSRWHNLLSLDVIKARNKPKEPPKKVTDVPFFLPTIAGLEFRFDLPKPEDQEGDSSAAAKLERLQPLTEFGKLVKETTENYACVIERLKSMGPSAIEVELRSLSPDFGGSAALMTKFIEIIRRAFRTNKDFEAVQAYLGLFLKLHSETILDDDELRSSVVAVCDDQKRSWERLQHKLMKCLCLIDFIKSPTL